MNISVYEIFWQISTFITNIPFDLSMHAFLQPKAIFPKGPSDAADALLSFVGQIFLSLRLFDLLEDQSSFPGASLSPLCAPVFSL